MGILGTISKYFPKKKQMFFALVTVAILVAIYFGINHIRKYINDKIANKEANTNMNSQPESDGESSTECPSEITLYYFYTEWCPHCKKSKPKIINLLKKYGVDITSENFNRKSEGNFTVKNSTVHYKLLDGDDNKNGTVLEKYKVEGYPTILIDNNSKILNFDAQPDLEKLVTFLESAC